MKAAVCFSIASLAVSSFGFGPEGHQVIILVAKQRMKPETAAKVSVLLTNQSIEEASTWPDDIRLGANPGKLANTRWAKSFNSRFPQNATWHFVALPLGTAAYLHDGKHASKEDIVHALERCITVLEGKPSPMTQQEALCWLIHLVGDIHQPLHAGAGFYQFDENQRPTLITDPVDALGKAHDRGGNRLRLDSQWLHAYWDFDVVARIETQFKKPLRRVVSERPIQDPQTDSKNISELPAIWVISSLKIAQDFYTWIEFGQRVSIGNDWYINIKLPNGTDFKHIEIAADQLSRAASNLAKVLDEIRWKITAVQ